MRRLARLVAAAALPLYLYAHVNGLPIRRTGATVDDNGLNCSECHTGTPVNFSNGLAVLVSAYSPGLSQSIRIDVSDSSALNFGFQLTARLANDVTKQAGTFSPTADSQIYCDPDGRAGPCNGAVEFVTHTPASAGPYAGGKRQFSLSWTPPGRDLGPVIFYGAALAGNHDGTAGGDHVFTSTVQAPALPCNLTGSPTIGPVKNAVTDAASYRGTISSKELISIFGSGLASPLLPPAGYRAVRSDLVNGTWPLDLACVGVEINQQRVPVFFVSPNQINVQAPVFPAGDFYSVQVILNPDVSNRIASPLYQVSAGALAPALFTFNGQGTGDIAAIDATKSKALNKVVYLTKDTSIANSAAAAPGDIIEVFGTGFGETQPPYGLGVFADPQKGLPNLTNPITVTIGTVTLAASDVLYAGLAFDAPGLYQFNLRVPDVPDGDQKVEISMGAARTQDNATIPVKRSP
jgi:uncharacterized protein (TIGR03437 family)